MAAKDELARTCRRERDAVLLGLISLATPIFMRAQSTRLQACYESSVERRVRVHIRCLERHSRMEDEFEKEWQVSADRMSPDLPGVVFRLFRDSENGSRFVSLAGPWRTASRSTR